MGQRSFWNEYTEQKWTSLRRGIENRKKIKAERGQNFWYSTQKRRIGLKIQYAQNNQLVKPAEKSAANKSSVDAILDQDWNRMQDNLKDHVLECFESSFWAFVSKLEITICRDKIVMKEIFQKQTKMYFNLSNGYREDERR